MDNDSLFKNIDEILKVNYSIDTLYRELYSIEKVNIDTLTPGQKRSNTIKKKKIFDYLRISKSVENELYNKLNINQDNYDKIIDYIKDKFDSFDIDSNDYLSTISSSYNCREIRRLINRLNYYKPNDNNFSGLPGFQGVTIFFGEDMDRNVDTKKLDAIDKLKYAIEYDITNILLVLLEYYIDIDEDFHVYDEDDIKKALLKVKYDITYMKSNVETGLLNNNFIVYKHTKITNEVVGKQLGLTNREIEYHKNHYIYTVIIKYINEILDIKDSDINKNNIIKLTVLSNILIAHLLLLDNDTLRRYYNNIKANLEMESERKFGFKDSEYSENILLNCFEKIKELKEKLFKEDIDEKYEFLKRLIID